ncbi:MAG: ABC transporter ATP-binding protein [Prevotellaceae bacterium]|jgi:iron complex transport system ATP-binding protein|nr:ABC transporter ATP-binding protein [Prevotellaceae bacterium]
MKKTIDIQELMIGYRRRSSGYNGAIARPMHLSTTGSELLALVGLNGAGKSTLLRTIAGLQKPIDGKIFLCGKPLPDYSRNELAKIISFVSTEPIAVPYLKVFDLAAMGRYPYTGRMGHLNEDDKYQVLEALELVGLRAMAWRNVSTLSDGERQRVMIARTLVQDTPIVLFDEPTAYLDMPNKYETLALLQRLAHNRHKTIIYSTHDISLATRTADKLWLITPAGISEGAPEDSSIQRAIKELFNSTNVEYSTHSGDFRPKNIVYGEITVYTKNDPQRIRQALARWGYNCILNPRIPREDLPKITLNIKKTEQTIDYHFSGVERRFTSFYDLGMYITKHPPAMPTPAPTPVK